MKIVLFNRKLTRRIAGGARAVYQRATAYAEAGFDVTMVFLDFVDDRGLAPERLRADGILHPEVKLLRFWRDAVPPEAYQLASAHPVIRPPASMSHWYGPRLLSDELKQANVSKSLEQSYKGGPIRLFEYHDNDDRLVERWRFDRQGRLLCIENFDVRSGQRVRCRYFAMGRLCWLDADMTESEGRGGVKYASGLECSAATFAEVVAGWLDRTFAGCERFVCIADGENTSQNALRAMKHPGVRGVSVLHNCHTVYPHRSTDPIKPHWLPFFNDLNNVHQMVCLTKKQFDDLKALYPELPLRVVHHFAPVVQTPKVRRDPNLIVFVGRLSEQKQISHTLRAFAIVSEAIPRARLDIYGEGSERDAVEKEIDELGLGDVVRLCGFTDRPDKAFASAAVAVMTSLYEGLPLALTEAMSVGTPFVAYDLNYGPAEVIRNGKNGFLTPANDIEACAERLIQVLRSHNLQRSLSENARLVLEEFSYTKYCKAWVDVAETALQAGALEEGRSAGRPADGGQALRHART